jgi:hypothetical protein
MFVIGLKLDYTLDKSRMQVFMFMDAGKLIILEIDLFLYEIMLSVMNQAEKDLGGRFPANTVFEIGLEVFYYIEEVLMLLVYELDAGIIIFLPGIGASHNVKIDPGISPANDINHTSPYGFCTRGDYADADAVILCLSLMRK